MDTKNELRQKWLGYEPKPIDGDLFLTSIRRMLIELKSSPTWSSRLKAKLPSKKLVLGCYSAIGAEPKIELESILELATESNLETAFPWIGDSKQMIFTKVDSQTKWQRSPLGFREVSKAGQPGGDIQAVVPDLILVPGLAFDQRGFRLGRGKGFYDRYFATLSKAAESANHNCLPVRIGVCYESQIVDKLPIDQWDVPMNFLATEIKMRQC